MTVATLTLLWQRDAALRCCDHIGLPNCCTCSAVGQCRHDAGNGSGDIHVFRVMDEDASAGFPIGLVPVGRVINQDRATSCIHLLLVAVADDDALSIQTQVPCTPSALLRLRPRSPRLSSQYDWLKRLDCTPQTLPTRRPWQSRQEAFLSSDGRPKAFRRQVSWTQTTKQALDCTIKVSQDPVQVTIQACRAWCWPRHGDAAVRVEMQACSARHWPRH